MKKIMIKLLVLLIAISNYFSTTSSAFYSVIDKSRISEKEYNSMNDYMSI